MARLTNDVQLSRSIDRLLPSSCHANVNPFIRLVHIMNCQHTTAHSYSNVPKCVCAEQRKYDVMRFLPCT